MIELIPAIDIINGQCVRLTQGDYDAKTVYSANPTEVAVAFERMGLKRLHVVDLDGAKSRHIVNSDVLRSITSHTHLAVDFGGGLKTDADIEEAFECGASMVTVGSVAVTSPALFTEWLRKYGPDRIILGAVRLPESRRAPCALQVHADCDTIHAPRRESRRATT